MAPFPQHDPAAADESDRLFARYQELQQYAAWSVEDAERVQSLGPLVSDSLAGLVEDFYAEIERHPDAAKVITGGQEQITRLKGTLVRWLLELFAGTYDAAYVARRWRVGLRHVEIGLDQVYTNMALSRLRLGLVRVLSEVWTGPADELMAALTSLHKLLDLDLAIIEDAYQSEHLRRQQQTERMAAIGQVAGGIAHELRNPLNVIKTSVYYLLNARHPTAEKTAEHLNRIHKQVGLADGVITALSSFARLPLPNLEPFDLKTMIEEALEICSLPPSINVTLSIEPNDSRPLGDPAQLRIVFSNLIRNARDAMPEGGHLKITAVGDDPYVPVTVEDTGNGIAPEHLARVMEPLFTTKARGIGLGLAIARAIIEKHRGQITVDSEPGAGTTFTVKLPATRL
jgi:signal transduction histidine kinase